MSIARLEYIKVQLKHPLPTIRYNAVRSLAENEDAEAVSFLREVMVTDNSEGIRSAAAEILADWGYAENALAN